ncbi:MAG: protein BatD [Ruminiclostridium sp.]|nr:protein BatD [Ruminiclostridium sp.]
MTGKKRRMGWICIILILPFMLNLTAGAATAKDAEFTLTIDSLNLQMGISGNLVLSLVNAQNAKVTEIKGLDSFDVLSSSQSTSTQIINGDMTNKKELFYIIMPKQTGQFALQAAIEHNGQTYLTNELTVNVSESAGSSEEEAEDLFIKTVISQTKLVPGQKAVLTYELYSRYNIENFGFLDSITLDGFIASDTPEDQLQAGYVYINGNKYVKYEARQLVISALKPGTFTLPAYNFQVNVSTGDFFSSSKPVYLQTDPLELTVNPLPNQPADFSGVIGKLNLDSGYSRQELNYGDSITLRVTASGSCNLDSLNTIFKDGVPGFSVYETQKSTQEGVESNQYHARKEFEIILVPETNGEIKIDPVYISYYNSETGAYENAEIPGETIMVHGNAPAVQDPAQAGSNSIETVRIEQVQYNTESGEYLTIQLKKENLVIALWAFGGIFALGLAAFLFILWQKRRSSEVDQLYRNIKKSDDHNEIYNLFNAMIKACFHISLKADTRDTIRSRLSAHGLDGLVLEIQDSLEGKKSKDDIGEIKSSIKRVYTEVKKHKKLIYADKSPN